jgi:hypothetical protein
MVFLGTCWGMPIFSNVGAATFSTRTCNHDTIGSYYYTSVKIKPLSGSELPRPESLINTFVIFTGKIIAEMPFETGAYVSEIIPDPQKAEIRFISGDITSVGNKLGEYLRSIQASIKADQVSQKYKLSIRTITAELPINSGISLSLFLQQLEAKQPEPGEQSAIAAIEIHVYILDKQ